MDSQFNKGYAFGQRRLRTVEQEQGLTKVDLSQLSTDAAVVCSFDRLIADYAGPLARVTRASDATSLDCYSKADADRFVEGTTGTVPRYYDQLTGTSMPMTGTWNYVTTGRLAGAEATLATDQLPLLSAQATALAAAQGCTMALAMGNLPTVYSPSHILCTVGSANGTRYSLRADTSYTFIAQGRRVDTDSNSIVEIKEMDEYLISVTTMSYANSTVTSYVDGEYFFNDDGFGTVGATDALGGAAASRFSVPADGIFYGGIIFASVLSSADLTLLNYMMRDRFSDARLSSDSFIGDWAYTWWSNYTAVSPDGARILLGGNRADSKQCAIEIDIETKKVLDHRVLVKDFWGIDDHHATAPLYMPNGALLLLMTGHGSDRTRTFNDSTFYRFRSENGRIATLAAPTIIPTTMIKSNYLQPFMGSEKAIFITNDDYHVNWLAFRSEDMGVNFTQCRAFAGQAGAPGGGANQIYCKAAQSATDTLRLFFIPHPSNLQNPIYLAALDIQTGAFSDDGGLLGNIYSSSSLTEIADVSTLFTVATPAGGNSHRLMDVADSGLKFITCEFTNGTGASATYYLHTCSTSDPYTGTWNKRTIVAAGDPFFAASLYFGGACFDRSVDTLAIYVSREDAGTWYIDRMTSVDDGQNWSTTNIASDAALGLLRPISPKGARSNIRAFWQRSKLYGNFDNYILDTFWA